MKNLLIIGLLLFCQFALAQNVTITVKGSPDAELQVDFPVNGTLYWPNAKKFKLDDNHTATFPVALTMAGEVRATNNEKGVNVFIEPKQAPVSITVNTIGKKQSITVQGPNAEGIMLLNDLKHPFYQSKSRAYVKKDSTMAGINRLIDKDMANELRPFDSLRAINKISPAFYGFASHKIQYYYAAVSASVIYVEYFRTTYDVKHPNYKATFNKDMEDAWPELFKKFPLTDENAISSPEFFYYAKDYLAWYQMLYLEKKAGNYKKRINYS